MLTHTPMHARRVAAATEEPEAPHDHDTPMAEAAQACSQSDASDGSGSEQDDPVSGDEDSDGGSDGGSDGFDPEDDQDDGMKSDDSDVQIIAQVSCCDPFCVVKTAGVM